MTDPGVRQEAHGVLSGLFSRIGQNNGTDGRSSEDGGTLAQITEFIEMPMELAQIFLNMSIELAELVLKSLEEAGIVLVKGMTPA